MFDPFLKQSYEATAHSISRGTFTDRIQEGKGRVEPGKGDISNVITPDSCTHSAVKPGKT